MNSIKAVVSEPIKDHEEYHMLVSKADFGGTDQDTYK